MAEKKKKAIQQTRDTSAVAISERLIEYGLYKSEHDVRYHTYQLERRIFEAFREGDPSPVLAVIDNPSDIHLGIMSRSAYKQSEYMAVLIISMLVREAMEAGVSPDQAYNINDLYLQALSESASTEAHRQIARSAAVKLQELLTQTRKTQSPHVEACKNYIAAHLHRDFTLEDIAVYAGVSPTYLSALFSRTEHISLTEYTLRRRIAAAQNMLRFSDYPIVLIAEYLCFCSQSYFSTVFKRITGVTPLNYRKQFLLPPHDESSFI